MSQSASTKEVCLAKRIGDMPVQEKIRLALMGDGEARALLVREQNKLILSYLLQNPRMTEHEILRIAKEKSMPEEILHMLSKKKEWMKKYPVRLALAQNPKTRLPLALKLLGTFRDADLRKIARSKDVSAHLSACARRILIKRGLL